MIQTVLGKIDQNDMKHTQCHEHLFIAKGKSYDINPSLCIDDPYKTFAELKKFKFSKGGMVVDAQPVGCGRMAKELMIASKISGVHIIASTGFHKLMFYHDNHWIHDLSTEEFASMMISEICDGMFIGCDNIFPLVRINSKAGMIKMAVDNEGLTKPYKRLFDAGIKASLMTGIPVQCHIEKAEQGEDVARYLLSKGLRKDQIILAHMDRDTNKYDEIVKVARLGVYLQLDTIGRFKYHSDKKEIQLIDQLIEKGFLRQLLIGLDTTRARLKAYGGDIGLDYILETFIPAMKKAGISEENIKTITTVNPGNALGMVKQKGEL